jgi:hypothetical protein
LHVCPLSLDCIALLHALAVCVRGYQQVSVSLEANNAGDTLHEKLEGDAAQHALQLGIIAELNVALRGALERDLSASGHSDLEMNPVDALNFTLGSAEQGRLVWSATALTHVRARDGVGWLDSDPGAGETLRHSNPFFDPFFVPFLDPFFDPFFDLFFDPFFAPYFASLWFPPFSTSFLSPLRFLLASFVEHLMSGNALRDWRTARC